MMGSTSERDIALSDKATFEIAICDLQTALNEKQPLYDDPSTAVRQRHKIKLEIVDKLLSASAAHIALRESDLEAREAREGEFAAVDRRLDLLETAVKHPIIKSIYDAAVPPKHPIPIKLQLVYWLLSAFCVLSSQISVLEQLAHLSAWPTAVMALLAMYLPRKLFSYISIHTCIHWFALYKLAVVTGCLIEPVLQPLSTELLTSRHILVLHWCMAFFVISEAEWHRHRHKTIAHPIYRDVVPWVHSQASSYLNLWGIRAFKWTLTLLFADVSTNILRYIGGKDGMAAANVMFKWHGSDRLFATRWLGQIPQALVLLRPVRHSNAWLVDRVVDLCGRAWLRLLRNRRQPVV
jgi:hypothetical protein